MSSHADWFAKKLGQPSQRATVPSVTPAVNGLRLPAVPHHQVQPVAQEAVQQATEQITGKENFQSLVSQAQANGEQVTFTKLSKHWHGGEGMRTEGHLRCPNCDSMNVFTRSNVRIMNERTGVTGHAKPRCFDCGWQEDFMPGGRENWGS